MSILVLFLLGLLAGWYFSKTAKTGGVTQDEPLPDEPWLRMPELDSEAGRKWEAEQSRKEGLRYAWKKGKKTKTAGKRGRREPAN